MSTPSGKRVTVKDCDIYPCVCQERDLFLHGCHCGAMQAARVDARNINNALADVEREEMRKVRDFFIKPPTEPITFRVLCPHCPHPPHQMEGSGCPGDNGRCLCGSVKP